MRLVYLLIVLGMSLYLVNPVLAAHKKSSKQQKTHYIHLATNAHYVASPKKYVKKPVVAKKSVKKFFNITYTPPITTSYGPAQLANQLNLLINNSNYNASIAVYIKSMQSGDSLYSRNINYSLIPASTMKILTAEAALLYLGADYKFSTQLLTDAKNINNGVLQGNLYVVLSGDPTLTYDDIVELMDALKAHQIQAISGNVYIDNTAYDQSFYGPGWPYKDKSYCYGAPISASIINHNCLPIHLPNTKGGTKLFYPSNKNMVVTKTKVKKVKRGNCNLRITPGLNSTLNIDDCSTTEKTTTKYAWGVSYVVTDVPDYNRALFKNVLMQKGIKVYGAVTFASAPLDLSLVSSHASEPLSSLITQMLKKSDNIIAGALFKKLGQLYSHRPGSWENGSIAVSQILMHHTGLNTNGLRILDGSGLSPNNLTTPAQMMKILDFAYHHPQTSNYFISALPIAGVDGTLKHRMGNIARKIRAKTGTISGVVALAGYAISADNEPLAFVIIINGNKFMSWRFRNLEDQIATALTKYKRSYFVSAFR